jgi:hypothetical protein
MHRHRKSAGLLTRLQRMKNGTPLSTAGDPGTVVPWDDAKVREILGPAAEVENLTSRGLIFAMDATASRQPTWDTAMEAQASMFSAFTPGLKVQLVYFRGAEFYVSPWSRKPAELTTEMRRVTCITGKTQIARVLAHGCAAAERGEVAALVYVGDCMEEPKAELLDLARRLGTHRVRAFMFHEGRDACAAAAFGEIAHLTKGAFAPLSEQSALKLKELLCAVSAYAAGGRWGLARLAEERPAARLLLAQLK